MMVFISHAERDAPLAGRVAEALESDGLKVWNPEHSVLPGDNWAAEVGRALEESQAMVVLLTPDALDSRWVRWEIDYALGARNYRNRLIPVVVGEREELPDSGIPWIVRHMPWVRLRESETGMPEVKPIADAIRNHA